MPHSFAVYFAIQLKVEQVNFLLYEKCMLDEFNILKVNCYTNSLLGCHQPPMNYSRNIPNITKYHSSKRSKEIFRFFFSSYDSRPFHRPVSHSFPLHLNKPIKCDEQSLDQIAAPQRHPQKKGDLDRRHEYRGGEQRLPSKK